MDQFGINLLPWIKTPRFLHPARTQLTCHSYDLLVHHRGEHPTLQPTKSGNLPGGNFNDGKTFDGVRMEKVNRRKKVSFHGDFVLIGDWLQKMVILFDM